MAVFVHGEVIEYRFELDPEPLEVMVEVEIQGSTLWLKDMTVYAGDGSYRPAGITSLREMCRQTEQIARLEGFERIRITAERHSGATPGRAVRIERVL